MQKGIFHTAILVLAAALMPALISPNVALAASEDRAIDRVRMEFNSAFNAGDAKAMASLLDQDCVWMPPGEPAIAGKDKVAALYGAYFEAVQSVFELKPGLIQLSGKWAFLSGAFTRIETAKANKAVKEVSGHYLFVLKKRANGSWRIARDIWNEAAAKP